MRILLCKSYSHPARWLLLAYAASLANTMVVLAVLAESGLGSHFAMLGVP